MPKVSVIIPTHNRPELLKGAIKSVLNQTFQDFEIIVVDDGLEKRANNMISSFNDKRIKYIQHKKEKGGGAARNTGIKNSSGNFIAFLDDDDEWLPKKLKIQMGRFENTPDDIGFCFSAVKNIHDNREEISEVPDGIANYFELALRRFKGFLTVTLVVKRFVFDKMGLFDEKFPSHQEVDLIIRIAKKYKGLGINQPLVKVSMSEGHRRVGSNSKKRIAGREMILKKYYSEFKKRPKILAKHYFQLALFCRDDKQLAKAKDMFRRAWQISFKIRYFLHYLSMIGNGRFYKILRD